MVVYWERHLRADARERKHKKKHDANDKRKRPHREAWLRGCFEKLMENLATPERFLAFSKRNCTIAQSVTRSCIQKELRNSNSVGSDSSYFRLFWSCCYNGVQVRQKNGFFSPSMWIRRHPGRRKRIGCSLVCFVIHDPPIQSPNNSREKKWCVNFSNGMATGWPTFFPLPIAPPRLWARRILSSCPRIVLVRKAIPCGT